MLPRRSTSLNGGRGKHDLFTAACWHCIVACWFQIMRSSVLLQIWSLYQSCRPNLDLQAHRRRRLHRSSSAAGSGSSTILTVIPSTLSNTLNKEIRGSVYTAVHVELMSKDARRRNVVISGFPSKPGVSDTALVDEFVETEFGYRPLIARTRRL